MGIQRSSAPEPQVILKYVERPKHEGNLLDNPAIAEMIRGVNESVAYNKRLPPGLPPGSPYTQVEATKKRKSEMTYEEQAVMIEEKFDR